MPQEVDGSTAEYPRRYDKKVQKPVNEAYRKLNLLGVAAFPHLINHFDDQRYALTADGGSMDVNFTVGELCLILSSCRFSQTKGGPLEKVIPVFARFVLTFQHISNCATKKLP